MYKRNVGPFCNIRVGSLLLGMAPTLIKPYHKTIDTQRGTIKLPEKAKYSTLQPPSSPSSVDKPITQMVITFILHEIASYSPAQFTKSCVEP